ncbi:class I SAM-dependent methyltransferase [Rubripirellula reticaptiva]|uniref:Bifunctional 3-demethylubiquinone-9 3-methyltransferase/ 2-octaprenyl-6-hydroxy phenol methylase n=1 Tax=Rubripirellula reticaptiva TaxID=2528013 RepID=A0A5C6F8A7_9BACT|nr:class I SAM-dependent methyltransferase [Rubripirellula reticaptiva]TWU57983.1 bifunctional 3-demethylubiquinone-9 3-methyltransferase/ 2-octaprenyl-6-hydroxy phenol methylase [Rubripirellula reticaptiva]
MNDFECPLCERELIPLRHQVRDAQTGEAFDIAGCPVCGLGVTAGMPNDLDQYYGKEYVGRRHGFTASMCDRRRIRIIRGLVQTSAPAKLLDVGCGDGTFLGTAIQAGYAGIGVERFSSIAADAGLPVKASLDETASESPFDIVTMWHVLEHLPNPGEVTEQLRGQIADNGVLVIAVPDFGSLPSRLVGRFWLHLDVPRHAYHFTTESLTKLLSDRGFDVEFFRGSEFEYDLLGWSSSAIDALGGEPNLLFKLLTGRSTKTGRLGRIAALALGAVLSVLGAVPVLIAGWLGRGGTLIAIARPKSANIRVMSEKLEGRIV